MIIESNITHAHTRARTHIYIDWAFSDNNISILLEVCPNLTYYAKTSKFINMFPNIK
jgi:hypothetical protein